MTVISEKFRLGLYSIIGIINTNLPLMIAPLNQDKYQSNLYFSYICACRPANQMKIIVVTPPVT